MYLLEKGADPTAEDEYGEKPLSWAIHSRHKYVWVIQFHNYFQYLVLEIIMKTSRIVTASKDFASSNIELTTISFQGQCSSTNWATEAMQWLGSNIMIMSFSTWCSPNCLKKYAETRVNADTHKDFCEWLTCTTLLATHDVLGSDGLTYFFLFISIPG